MWPTLAIVSGVGSGHHELIRQPLALRSTLRRLAIDFKLEITTEQIDSGVPQRYVKGRALLRSELKHEYIEDSPVIHRDRVGS